MAIRVGINGFGRIGRQVLRAALQSGVKDIEFVAVNDLTDTRTLAHLFKYDSVHREFDGDVVAGSDSITVNGQVIRILAEKDPVKLPWADMQVDIVLESTGRFTESNKARQHLTAGAKKVIISAPAKGEDITVVMGVNHERYDAKHHTIISNASCTTNCLVPMVKVVRDNFGFVRGSMLTVHSYTNDQSILDLPHKDLVIPELKGKIDGMSIRVPTPDVSFTDLAVVVDKAVTAEAVNDAFRKAAAEGPLKGILKYTEEELVSSDYIGNPYSCILDGKCTNVVDGLLVKVSGWYDNEWGYASRCVDLLQYVGARL
jgi:glyceraldehyde 3-phosphate dehydrogenase